MRRDGPAATAARAVARRTAEARSGRFSLLTYDVAGLAQLGSDSDPGLNAALISPLLNHYDVALVQEDFAYHGPLGAQANTTAALSQPMAFVCPSSAPRGTPGQANSQQKDYSINGGSPYPSTTTCICPDRFGTTWMNGFTAVNSWLPVAAIALA